MCQPVTASAQSESVARSDGNSDLMAVYTCVSSANWWYDIPKVDISVPTGVVKIENRSGPRTDHWETPVDIFTVRDRHPPAETKCSRPDR